MRPATAVCRLRGHQLERTLGDPRGEVDVVRREILDDAHVGDPAREGTLAAGDDLEDAPQVALGDHRSGPLQRGVVALDMTDGPDEPSRTERLGESSSAGGVRGERLLQHGVHARFGQHQADLLVQTGRGGHHAVVQALGDKFLDGGQHLAAPCCPVNIAAWVSDGDEVNTVQ